MAENIPSCREQAWKRWQEIWNTNTIQTILDLFATFDSIDRPFEASQPPQHSSVLDPFPNARSPQERRDRHDRTQQRRVYTIYPSGEQIVDTSVVKHDRRQEHSSQSTRPDWTRLRNKHKGAISAIVRPRALTSGHELRFSGRWKQM